MRVLRVGHAETFKACWHGGLLVLCGGAALYNAAAWLARRKEGQPPPETNHLAVNAVVYVALAAFEAKQVGRHLEHLPWATTILPFVRSGRDRSKTANGSATTGSAASTRS